MILEIIQEVGKSNVESLEMADELTGHGIKCRVSDPEDIEDANILWNKINTVFWRELVKRRPEVVPVWQDIANDVNRRHLNHFVSRTIIENKRCLAFMQDARYTDLFDAEEKSLIAEICPSASICEPDLTVKWRGNTGRLSDLLLKNKDSFVLKQPFDIRGDGVSIGEDSTENEWNQKVQLGMEERHICQEYIPSLQLPLVKKRACISQISIMNTSLDTFVFGGRVIGYGAKASTHNRVNLFKGGQKPAVLVGQL